MIGFPPFRPPTTPVLRGERIVLRSPQLSDHRQWVALRDESRQHLTRWEPDWTPADLTIDAFRTRLHLQNRLFRSGAALSLFVFLEGTDELIGGVILSDIRRYAAQSATIGYWIGVRWLQQGLGSQSVRLALEHAFGDLRLNRVEAACQPGNVASRALLAKAGFHEEGYARDYLHINGEWRDHLLFAATARELCGAPPRI